MQTIAEIEALIKELQEKKTKIKLQGKRNAIKEIKAKMAEYGITLEDLQPKSPEKVEVTRKVKEKKQQQQVIKFRKSDLETWAGRGPKPKWVKGIEAKGESIDKYRVDNSNFESAPRLNL